MKYKFTSKGQIFIEPKAEMKLRLKKAGLTAPSPNKSDAFVLAVTDPGAFNLARLIQAWGR